MKKVKILFDPIQHKYTDDEGNVYTSVTTKIKEFEEEYDNEFWAMYRALDQMGYKLRPDTNKRMIWVQVDKQPGNWYGLKELYNGIFRTYKTPEVIKQEWVDGAKQSTDRGNDKHNALEDAINTWFVSTGKSYSTPTNIEQNFKFKILNEEELKNSPLSLFEPEIYTTLTNAIKAGFVLYAEQRVYSYEHKVSGTIDVLAVRGKEFYIIDWKTNKNELKFEAGYYKKAWDANRQAKLNTSEFILTDKRLKAPVNDLQNCKGVLYTLQLSMYAYLCELWGLECKGLILCHIRPMLNKYDEEILGLDGKCKFYPAQFYNISYLKSHVHKIINI
jgi:hypothetical protein